MQQNEALHNLLDAGQQEEIAWADGEELLPTNSGNSSLTSDMSFSERDNSNNIGHIAPFMGVVPADALINVVPAPQEGGALGVGMQNLMQAYLSDDDDIQPVHEFAADTQIVAIQNVAAMVEALVPFENFGVEEMHVAVGWMLWLMKML